MENVIDIRLGGKQDLVHVRFLPRSAAVRNSRDHHMTHIWIVSINRPGVNRTGNIEERRKTKCFSELSI